MTRVVQIETDGGPWATHDMPCGVHFDKGEKAVLNLNDGVFEPSWRAQSEGWRLVCVAPGWRRRVFDWIFA